MPTPLPPVMPLPGAFEVPAIPLAPPQFEPPRWEPIPIYRDEVPALNPQPAPEEKEDQAEEAEEQLEPPPIEVLDMVEEMRTFTPPVPPYYPEVEETMETIELPGGFDVPVPPKEIMVTAVTTAGAAAIVSVGATMAAGRIFEQVVKIAKPVFKAVLNKLAKARGKKAQQTWARERLLASRQRIRGRRGYRDGS